MTRVYRIAELVKPAGKISRSALYAHAAAGRIVLRKVGGVTVVTESEWRKYIEGEPLIHKAASAA